MKPQLIFVAGFLGIKKTPLFQHAASLLQQQGHRAGIILNTMKPALQDVQSILRGGYQVREVSGHSLAGDFQSFVNRTRSLYYGSRVDVVLAESLGSYTDLTSTVLEPLRTRYRHDFRVGPLSVLVDPVELAHALSGNRGEPPPKAGYIFWKQIEEADFILLTRLEQTSAQERDYLSRKLAETFPDQHVFWLSTESGEGVSEWLQQALSFDRRVRPVKGLEIDYSRYTEAVSALSWYGGVFRVRPGDADQKTDCHQLLDELSSAIQECSREIGCPLPQCTLEMRCHEGGCCATLCPVSKDRHISLCRKGDRNPMAINLEVWIENDTETLLDLMTAAMSRVEQSNNLEILPERISISRPPRPQGSVPLTPNQLCA